MKRIITTLVIMVTSVLMIAGCKGQDKTATERQEEARASIMERADRAVPTPKVNNFATRESVAEYMERMDDPQKTFYLYIISDAGSVIGYHVSQGAPVNICTFMTPPDRVNSIIGEPDVVRSAPGIDGVYYGKGACNKEYFFDAETGALIQIQGNNLIVSDQPLDLDAEPIGVKTE